jgi:hypothetical protein
MSPQIGVKRSWTGRSPNLCSNSEAPTSYSSNLACKAQCPVLTRRTRALSTNIRGAYDSDINMLPRLAIVIWKIPVIYKVLT